MNNNKKRQLVLVVDDHPKVLRFIEIDLKLRGFEVLTTTSGEQALEMVRSASPDVMLLDIVMPEMDGLEVMRKLRAFSQIPVIAISASPGNHDVSHLLGASDFMAKPFHPDEMARKIETLINH